MVSILVRSCFFCLSPIPYLDQEEIKLRKKFPYSYSIRLAFHMAGSYHLTIFIYYLGLWPRHLKSYPLSVNDLGEKLTSNIWFPHRESNPGRLGEAIFNLLLILHFCFTFNLGFCFDQYSAHQRCQNC